MRLAKIVLIVFLVIKGLNSNLHSASEPSSSNYAVIVSEKTDSNPSWKRVVETLVVKHNAQVLKYTNAPVELLASLRRKFPRYACFVAQPEYVSREFVAEIHQMTRNFDDDPFTDCFWGILTGYNAENALEIARHSEPLTIRKVASGTDVALDMVEEGIWYCELNKNKMVKKEAGRTIIESKGPDDTTLDLVNTLNHYRADLFITSGHATERDWQIGFRYRNGYFKHKNGKLFGWDTLGQEHPINSANPKVYMPIGNCLMGHIDRPDCMATSWMNSAGVKQMLGYTVPTWYGYQGWGVLDYFVEQPGRYTFTEAFFANHHALIHRLVSCFPDLLHAKADVNGRLNSKITLNDKAKQMGLTLNDGRGLVFDRDFVAFYGDPAWQAKMADSPKAFEVTLTNQDSQFILNIKPNWGEKSFNTINSNGVQRGGRPIIAYLPYRIKEITVVEGRELDPVVTDDFILVPNPRVCDPNKKYRIVISGDRFTSK